MVNDVCGCVAHDATRVHVKECGTCFLPVAIIATLRGIRSTLVGFRFALALTEAADAISDLKTARTDTRRSEGH